MNRIERLTPEQEAILPKVRDEWLRIGLSTERADRPAAEAGVAQAYRAAGLEPPRTIIWLDSPYQGALAAAMLVRFQPLAEQVGDQVREQVWAQVGDQVGAQVGEQVGEQVGDQVWTQVREQVRERVRERVGDQVWAQVWAQVGDQVGDEARRQVSTSLWGQHDAAWLGWNEAFGRLGLDLSVTAGLRAVARSAGWWWAFRGVAILTERPLALRRDERGRLHCETGPAIVYPDGWGVWAWHGVRVPREVIEEPVTIEQIRGERNAEVRRIMIERFGLDRYITDAGLTKVGCDDWGDLYRLDDDVVVVAVINSTPEPDGTVRTYHLRVPPEFGSADKTVTVPMPPDYRRRETVPRTPHAAVAWTFGLTPDQYLPEMQT